MTRRPPVPPPRPKWITTPSIQRAIEECRPAYQRAMAPKKPTGRPRKQQEQHDEG